ncbi:MAG: hypothetical protein HYS40_02240 [Gemmatimonadetes bacterium]|nr:hypothetical protein [Gemmatimonadota bacterium]
MFPTLKGGLGRTLLPLFLILHPLHTTVTRLAWRAADRTIELEIRAFADDFQATAGTTDSTMAAYLRSAVTLGDRDGHRLPLRWCGVRRTDDLLWLCVRAPAPEGPQGLRLYVGVLFERFPDQINIVQADYDGRRESLLFAPGDAPRRLP